MSISSSHINFHPSITWYVAFQGMQAKRMRDVQTGPCLSTVWSYWSIRKRTRLMRRRTVWCQEGWKYDWNEINEKCISKLDSTRLLRLARSNKIMSEPRIVGPGACRTGPTWSDHFRAALMPSIFYLGLAQYHNKPSLLL